jgi:hypothetical protein
MVSILAVGLDGREIPPDELAAEQEPALLGQDGIVYDIEVFDGFPKWARDALREMPKFDVKARDVAPHIATGVVNPITIHALLMGNDARMRYFFKQRDAADGLA